MNNFSRAVIDEYCFLLWLMGSSLKGTPAHISEEDRERYNSMRDEIETVRKSYDSASSPEDRRAIGVKLWALLERQADIQDIIKDKYREIYDESVYTAIDC